MLKTVTDFFTITDKAIWQDVILSSLLIPFVIWIFEKIRMWINSTRPLRLLLKGYVGKENEVLLYLSQFSGADASGNQNPNQKYVTFYPSPLPTNRSNKNSALYQNIDPVWSESDGRCAADIFNILGRVGKNKNIKIADTVKDWGKHITPIFSIGFNPKTQDLLTECEPINYSLKDLALSIDGSAIKLDSGYPGDAGIIQKTFVKNTSVPVFILAGLGTLGTEVSGNVLSRNCVELGKLYGSKTFCLLFKTDITKGRDYYDIKSMYPKPAYWRAILYPVTFFRWHGRNIF